jgi:hypothetical protein
MTNTPATAANLEPWAEVRASDRVMRYRRSGAGPTVLLLGTAEGPSPVSTELLQALGARCRLIAPEIPPNANVTVWLSEFLEGIGTCPVTILAANSACMPAIELALRDLGQIKRLVLIPDGEPDDSTAEGALSTTLGSPKIPVLIVRPGLAAVEAIPIVTNFLAAP